MSVDSAVVWNIFHGFEFQAKTPSQWEKSSQEVGPSPPCRGGAGLWPLYAMDKDDITLSFSWLVQQLTNSQHEQVCLICMDNQVKKHESVFSHSLPQGRWSESEKYMCLWLIEKCHFGVWGLGLVSLPCSYKALFMLRFKHFVKNFFFYLGFWKRKEEKDQTVVCWDLSRQSRSCWVPFWLQGVLSIYFSSVIYSPWYNCHGWLSVKSQLSICLCCYDFCWWWNIAPWCNPLIWLDRQLL